MNDLQKLDCVKLLQIIALKDKYPNNADFGDYVRQLINNYEKDLTLYRSNN